MATATKPRPRSASRKALPSQASYTVDLELIDRTVFVAGWGLERLFEIEAICDTPELARAYCAGGKSFGDEDQYIVGHGLEFLQGLYDQYAAHQAKGGAN